MGLGEPTSLARALCLITGPSIIAWRSSLCRPAPNRFSFWKGRRYAGARSGLRRFRSERHGHCACSIELSSELCASFPCSFIWFRRRSLCSPRSGRGACLCVFTYCARSLALSWVIFLNIFILNISFNNEVFFNTIIIKRLIGLLELRYQSKTQVDSE